MTTSDLLAALTPIAACLEALAVRYYWSDIVGILKVTRNADRDYLRRWVPALGVADLLARAFADVDH